MREPIKWFANQMEQSLQKHDEERGSDGWLNEDVSWLFERLEQEVKELSALIYKYNHSFLEVAPIIKECSDVANFAMMIADSVR